MVPRKEQNKALLELMTNVDPVAHKPNYPPRCAIEAEEVYYLLILANLC